MWPFTKKTTQRRLEVRKGIPSKTASLWRRFRQGGGVGSVMLAGVFYLCVAMLDVWPAVPLGYRAGQYVRDDVRARVDFEARGVSYPPDKLLVRRSRRIEDGQEEISKLSEEDLALLRAEHEAVLSRERQDHPWRVRGRTAGRLIVLLLVTVLICVYIARYQRQITANHWRGFALVTVMVLMLALTKLMSNTLSCNKHCAVLPVLMAAVVVAIAYDQRFALAMGSVMTILVVSQLRAGLGMVVVLLGGLAACIFWLHEVRRRSKLIEVCALAAAVVFAAVWARALSQAVPWRFALIDSLWAAGFAMLAGFLTQGILPFIERVFRIATSMTLLEWCDASKPLLKRLAMEAPGTYNHSLQLGTMCEAAAEAVGAQGLLARVGAYYHDVGKINKPEYFIENQSDAQSKHDKLSPAMSLLIITGHVKDGIEMAREYGLPTVLHPFIQTHHGTTLVQYFYRAATDRCNNGTDRVPQEVEFRYPGPKPSIKEAAILMLADAAESSVRAMPEPAPGHIETQVQGLADQEPVRHLPLSDRVSPAGAAEVVFGQ